MSAISSRVVLARAMVLAAGLGIRMRPLTDTLPKPLIKVAQRPLIDHILDLLGGAGVTTAVVNVHYLADLLERHLAARDRPPGVIVSDERAALLDSGGGVKKALPSLGDAPFYVLNADSFWIDGPRPNLLRLAEAFDPARMDMLLLLASTATSCGYDGVGDFAMDPAGLLRRRREREVTPFVYAGALIVNPPLFAETPEGAFSLNLLFDKAAAAGRLHGLRLDGTWLHVGSPDAIAAAEDRLIESAI